MAGHRVRTAVRPRIGAASAAASGASDARAFVRRPASETHRQLCPNPTAAQPGSADVRRLRLPAETCLADRPDAPLARLLRCHRSRARWSVGGNQVYRLVRAVLDLELRGEVPEG